LDERIRGSVCQIGQHVLWNETHCRVQEGGALAASFDGEAETAKRVSGICACQIEHSLERLGFPAVSCERVEK
jgi:hypothetical protein